MASLQATKETRIEDDDAFNSGFRKAINKWEQECKDKPITLLVVGNQSSGKSTLIDNFFEVQSKKNTVTELLRNGVGMSIVVGRGDKPCNDSNRREFDLLFYCLRVHMHSGRVPPMLADNDCRAIDSLTKLFGKKVWNRAVLVLTSADFLSLKDHDAGSDVFSYYAMLFESALKRLGCIVPVKSIYSFQHRASLRDVSKLKRKQEFEGIIALPVSKNPDIPRGWKDALAIECVRKCKVNVIPGFLKVRGYEMAFEWLLPDYSEKPEIIDIKAAETVYRHHTGIGVATLVALGTAFSIVLSPLAGGIAAAVASGVTAGTISTFTSKYVGSLSLRQSLLDQIIARKDVISVCKEVTKRGECISPDERHFNAIGQAMEKKGKLDHTIVQGVFLGPARSGKSSLIKRLTGEGPSSISPSTGVASEPVHIQVRQSCSIPLSVTDSVWFKLTYNTEALELVWRIFNSIGSHITPETLTNLDTTSQTLDSEPVEVENPMPGVIESHAFEGASAESSVPTESEDLQPQSDQGSDEVHDGIKSPLEILKDVAIGTRQVIDHLEKSWSLYLTDTGGQLEFQDLLPLLVSGPSIFFFTFRLNQRLNQLFTIQYELSDGNKSQPYQSTLTTLDSILQSLATISSMGTFMYKDLNIPIRPKVFFIGTHKDQLNPKTAKRDIKKIDQYLQTEIKSTSHYPDSLIEFSSPDRLIFTVNNLSEDDADFLKIRKAVERLVQRGEFRVSSPSHWLIFGLIIRSLKPRIISFSECQAVARQCGITEEEELKEALYYLHTKLGVLRYFPEAGAGDIVIKDPQVLFDKVTELIMQSFTFEKVGKYLTDEFKKRGIFSMRDFERVSRDSNSLLTSSCLVNLLTHLRIVAPFQTVDGDTKYFIPCVLAHAKAAQATFIEKKQNLVPPLVVTFKCGFCPKGLSSALIVYLIRNEMKSEFEWSLQPDEIFRDQVSILVGPDFDTVIVSIQPRYIRIMFSPTSEADEADRSSSVEEICSEIRQSVEKGITDVVSDINYTSNTEHSLTFDCAVCDDPHPAEMRWHKGKPSRLHCSLTKKSFGLPSNYGSWFEQPVTRSESTATECADQTASINPIRLQSSHATPSPVPSNLDLRKMFPIMLPQASNWENIATILGIPEGTVKSIKRDYGHVGCNDCLREMLSTWLKQTDPLPTLHSLVEAVKLFDSELSQDIFRQFQ